MPSSSPARRPTDGAAPILAGFFVLSMFGDWIRRSASAAAAGFVLLLFVVDPALNRGPLYRGFHRMLSEIIKAFEARNPGVASFETFAAECMTGRKSDAANASIYLLLALTARQFYDQFADQPLTLERANDTRKRMVALARKAEAALRQPADAKLDVLNQIALEAFSNAG